MQVADVLWRRGSPSTQSQGSLSCCQETSPAPPPRIPMFFQGMCNFIMVWIFYRKMQSFYRKTRIFYRKVQTFYRKHELSTGSSVFYRKLPVEVWDGPEFILKGDLATKDRFGRMQASVGTLAHCCYLAPPSLLTCNQVPCTSKADRWVLAGKSIFKDKQVLRSHTTGIRSSGSVIERPDPPSCSVHPRRKNCY